ncbi:pathogenesis-related protein PR-1-like [Impatiens glandulifera]|uniref:pathogenesis-related protein PR-1-like n=1 Tax=Impatiens glandulifera TaxID=253017 RepID=UPI001FB05460|nr:pathogenesis-related protein PR-1-like [Impatiens glandulifera]
MIAAFLLLLFITGAGAYGGKSSSTAAQFLGPQNAARAALRLPPLTWSVKLQAYAEAYANRRKGDCALIHSPGNTYGENIFWGSGTGWGPAQAAGSWVSEKQYYRYFSNSCGNGQDCGHYTQIVWRSTKRVGCARVVCNGGRGVFMTCNYDPAGNYIGERPY